MSYDISIGIESFNITYNVSEMFYKHNKKGIRFIYGKTGLEASEMLIDMLNYFIRQQTIRKKLEMNEVKNEKTQG